MTIGTLKYLLAQAGFYLLKKRGKGSHFIYEHPDTKARFYGSGKDNQEAKHYQLKNYQRAIAQASMNA